MAKRLLLICFLIVCTLAGCGNTSAQPEPAPETDPPADETLPTSDAEAAPPATPDYSAVNTIFSDIIPESEVKVTTQGTRVSVRISTALGSDAAPEDWESVIESFGLALEEASPLAADYDAGTVSAEIYGADDSILASGFNGEVKYNLFAEKTDDTSVNPPTISKFEYDQISVGMSLSEVTDIIGGSGTAQNQIGDAGGYGSLITTYRWLGEKEGSYADILFDDYKVYSKHQIFLE